MNTFQKHMSRSKMISLSLAASCAVSSADDGGKPFQMSFTKGANGTWNADWIGEESRADHGVFFFQWSLDLVHWHYAPFMEFGMGLKSFGVDTDGEVKFFARLMYEDHPEISSLAAAELLDLDGDGQPSAWEVFHGFSPFSANPESEFLQHIAAQPAAPATFELHTPLQ